MKEDKEIPAGLKRPLGHISRICKGRKGNDFRDCQRLLSKKCLHLNKMKEASGEAFEACLAEQRKTIDKNVPRASE